MIDPTEALKHIKTLAVAGRDAESADLMTQHFSEIIQLVENVMRGDSFQTQIGEPRLPSRPTRRG